MKKLFFYTLMAGMLALASCDEDQDHQILELKTPAAFEALSQAEFTFNASNANEAFPEIKWSAADFGLSAAVTYNVSLVNVDAKDTVEIAKTTSTSVKMTNAEMNAFMSQIKAYPGQTYHFEVLLNVNAYDYDLSAASNTLNFTATPYDPKAVDWKFAYIAVGYPAWDYTTAYMIGDSDENGTYEGYAYFANDNTSFAVTSGSNATTVLSKENTTVAKKGFYKVELSADGSVTLSGPFVWGIIGDATPNGWSSDTNMEYDEETRTWSVITSLLDKEFKFRAGDWAYNYGAVATESKELTADGSNIKIGNVHAYVVKLNLTNAGKYSYSLEETDIEQSSAAIFLPGSYQGWAPDAANCLTLDSKARDFSYTGTHHFPANTEFKFYDGGQWTGISGSITWNESNSVGTFGFTLGSGENIALTDAGYYRIDVNTKKLTAKITKTGWEIIGSATPGAWDNGTLMTYNADGTWSIEVTLTEGEIKFRWDASWDKNLGGALAGLTDGGDNIKVTAGTYIIVLNPDAKTCTMTLK